MGNALEHASAGKHPLDAHSASIAEHLLRHIWGFASFARLYPGA